MTKSLAWVWLLLLQAVPVQAVTFGQMIGALEQRGIAVQFRKSCAVKGSAATYALSANTICVNTRLAPTTQQQSAALTHEVMHAAQDCLAGLNNNRMVPLHEYAGMSIGTVLGKLSTYQKSFIYSNYPRHQWKVEMEAYAFESNPAAVYQLLTHVC